MSSIFLNQIETALHGAKYHENCAFSFAGARIDGNSEKAVYHLRAYFWELWSIWDYILQQANRSTLQLEPGQVRPHFLEKVRERDPRYEFLNELEAIQRSGELMQIRRLRNRAHRWLLKPEEVVIRSKDNHVLAISLILDEEGATERVYLQRNDFQFMQQTVERLKSIGLFSHSAR